MIPKEIICRFVLEYSTFVPITIVELVYHAVLIQAVVYVVCFRVRVSFKLCTKLHYLICSVRFYTVINIKCE